MPEFNILEKAGLAQRKKRERAGKISIEDKAIAERLDFSFYDGSREKGYGGYYYDGRWKRVAEAICERYNLKSNSRVLIDRCHKGFLVYDLIKLIPGICVYGIHPKGYALNHAMEGFGRWASAKSFTDEDTRITEEKARQEVMPFLIQADARDMPFRKGYFDSVISIENACSFPEPECRKVIREIIRVSKNKGENCYIQNDSWTNPQERKKLMGWTFLCKTFLDIKGWEKLFSEEGYNGDFGFTIIE